MTAAEALALWQDRIDNHGWAPQAVDVLNVVAKLAAENAALAERVERLEKRRPSTVGVPPAGHYSGVGR